MKKIYSILLASLFLTPAIGQISLTGPNYTQDFNTLSNTAGSTTNALTIPGWLLNETGGGVRDNEQYAVDNGGSSTGDTYSYGTTAATDRALGALQSGTLISSFGAFFTNNTGTTLNSLTISYTGEQWRLGTAGRADRIDFQYSLNATSITTGTWVDVDALDFSSPITTGTLGALDGNATANRTPITSYITGISIPNGATFYIRWNDVNVSGADDGLSVDDFTISTVPVSLLSVAAGSNASEPSTNGNFNVTFSPSTTGSTTFNYALTGTATFNTDYSVTLSGAATPSPLVASSGTITVPASTASITVTITPIDDPTVEGNETIILTLSSPGGGYILGTASATINLGDDDATPTPIHTIQGSGTTATPGSFTTTGIVIGVYPTLSPAGFYIEEPTATWDADINTSEGIFVVSNATVFLGDNVRVVGTVQEDGLSPSFNQAVFATATVTVLSTGNPLPTSVDITLPVTATTDYEKYEAMLVRFPGTLTVSDNNNLGGFGEVKLSAGGLVYQPTQVIDPNDNPPSGTTSSGSSNVPAITALVASNNLRTILLDDGRAGTMPSLPYVNVDNTLRVGSTIDNIKGILGFAFSQYRIQPTPSFSTISFNHAARPAVPGYGVGANVKVASLNVLNYFNGNGAGGGFPTARGAHSLAEFNRQRDKIINALVTINADVVGLIEMENLDLNDATPALVDLVNGLNAIMGGGTYSFIDDDLDNNGAQDNGTDVIRCAIIYKSTVVSPVGAAMLGSDPVFDRPPLAQTFNVLSNNKTFNFIVNHFKSKGGCPGTGIDIDQGDGQACWNNRRKLQSNALVAFINGTVIPNSGTDRILTVGDYNAYYEEDPMDILRANNYSVLGTATSYSYLFAGQVGSLDHAVTSPSLTGLVTAISKWNANSVEPEYLDYNDVINDGGGDVVNPWASTYTVSPWRSGDHDAILIGLNLPITLPISLMNFTATKENTKSKITWTTSQEINSREFIVERSNNGGTSWLTVATVPAAGNSNSVITYTVLDPSPSKGVNLYRLKSIDIDARFSYSAIRKVNFDSKYTFTIYPNPVTDLLQISVDNATGFNANVQVLNAQGQILINKQWVSNSQLMQVDASSLPSGMYYIKIITADGTVSMQKFSKQ